MEFALRFAGESEDMLEGWLVPFGGSFDGKDTYRTFASENTDFCLDYFSTRPLLYSHGFDPEIRSTPIGRIVSLEKRDKGLWMEAQIDLHNQYISEIRELVKKGALGLSSGAIAHLVDIDKRSGEWRRWPVAEGSLTPNPSNLLATVDVATFKSHVRSAGIDVDEELLGRLEHDEKTVDPAYIEEIRAKLTSKERDDLPDSDFAYIDSKGGRHLPVNDKIHAKEALDRFDQTQFESSEDKEKARKKILAAAKKFGVEVSDDDNAARSTTVPLTVREDGSVTATWTPPATGLYTARIDTGNNTVTFYHGPYNSRTTTPYVHIGDITPGTGQTWTPYTITTSNGTSGQVVPATRADSYEKSFEDIRADIMDLLNPDDPFGIRTEHSYVVATYPDHVVICRCSDDDDDKYFRVPYTLDDQSEPVLDTENATEVEWQLVDVAPRAAVTPLGFDAQRLTREAVTLTERTKDLQERRMREGRVLSKSNHQLLSDAHDKMGQAHEALGDLLSRTGPSPEEAARANLTEEQAAQLAELEYLSVFGDLF